MNHYIRTLRELSISFLESIGVSNTWAILIQSVLALIFIFILSYAIGKLGKLLMQKYIPILVHKTKTDWDDKLFKNNCFEILSYYLFGLIFFWIDIFIASDTIRKFINTITGTYFTIITLMLINALLNTAYDIYKERRPNDKANLKIYLQLIKVLVFSFGGIIIISFFANKNLIDILKGLGAMAAILLIVYKDTIMGFVAGISLSTNKMVEVGDWISVPKHDADGTVIDIGLNTVKVQNFDKTITTIPPYNLISESFTNWKGMQQSGGRRIKRSINIDIDSIHFLSLEEIEKFSNFKLLKEYINEKKKAIVKSNEGVEEYYNQRRLTNIGTFKKYLENYLLASDFVHPDMTFIVRQLQSNEKGVPIEIYFFCTQQAWVKYEQVQSDIFDHIFAIAPEFGLQIFQTVSGRSLTRTVHHSFNET